LQFAVFICLPSCLSQETEKHGLQQRGQGGRDPSGFSLHDTKIVDRARLNPVIFRFFFFAIFWSFFRLATPPPPEKA